MFAGKILLSCTAMSALAGSAAYAQSSADVPEPQKGVVQDIIVTAQRRDERLQDVPVAVTAVNAEQLTNLGITSALDLRVAAPALNSTNASGVFASSIRGVGSFAFAPAVESPVALYIDGVYIAAPQSSEVALNNVENIEVLKGPQGTLFGRSATGGLIQITTATPTDQYKGDFSIGYGNFDSWTGKAYISGRIADGLAADFAFTGRHRGDGFGRNVTTSSSVGDVHHDISTRSKMVWTVDPATTVTLIGSYWDGRDTIGYPVPFPGKVSGFVPGRVGPDRGWDAESDVDFRKKGWTANGALKISHEFDAVRLLSITAYRKGQIQYSQDLDYSPFPVASLDLLQRDKQFSQELQLSSIGSGRLKWTAGLFYFHLASDYTPQTVDLSGVPGVNGAITFGGKETGRSYAGYGQATYELLDDTNLTLGGRYTRETRKDVDPSQIFTIPGVGSFPPSIAPTRSDTASRFTYRISLDHRFSDQILGYVSYNTGFKSGGFNAGNPSVAPYKPENLKAAELGLKTDLLDRHLRFNVSGFYYKYKNIQVQKIDLFSLFLTNGAAARIYGVDADFTTVLSDSFSFTGGFNWIDTKFEAFPGCPVSQPQGGVPLNPNGDCAGNQLPFAAKFTGSVAANYTTKLAGGEFAASANVYYNSGYAFEPDNVTKQDRYAKLGASLKWKADNGLSLGVYGTNLTNRRTVALSTTQTSGNVAAVWAEPRQYGVTLGYSF